MKKKDDNIEDFTREFLRRIDNKIDRVENDIRDIKFRVGQIEGTLVHHTGQLAYHTSQFDRLTEDIAVIKKRLDLVDA